MAQRDLALAIANAKRIERANLRKRVRASREGLTEVLLDPPACIDSMLLIDVVRMGFTTNGAAIQRLGRFAARDRINLMVPVDKSSQWTREWVAEHAEWNHGPKGRRVLKVAA
ncbi:MAG: hypothetical protein H0W81_06390 [Chloroflexi bacterium]|nr:hypothetical protein [Chloroflexota bacterium]